ncbi:hypothetical protein PCASD_19468 [Puccinia coronata f. sp. avenae]|uniref:BTB domain-containing protein n=1 Tax=Puccinia coronata f. sp. avenae TaxID=200324 RepID=A0A2N5TU12_9BASI|nr:hypothetical protein PCASD_19468 [Puccinia coronata f. sp. avenae]
MKPHQLSNQPTLSDINIHDVYQTGDLTCLRKFLKYTIEGTKKASLVSITINRRDQSGRTLLHKLSSSQNESDSIHWLELLQNYPLQLNIPDLESGWTPLHRALYHGNLRFASILIDQLECDLNIKDHEGLSAFDLYHSTIDEPIHSLSTNPSMKIRDQRIDLFTWGSNRNFVLGIHDDGDRHYPERIHLKRSRSHHIPSDGPPDNPFISNPVSFVAIGRLHTALITSQGELRVCGFGSGGRLGLTKSPSQDKPTLGISAETQFTFATVKGSGLAHQKVKFVALGQDHTVVITRTGQVFTFGMNRFGQLGYGPESAGATIENMIQVEPKRVLGLLKKVDIIGAAASRWHTAVFSSDSLFTWGANRGQLGYHNPHPHHSLASIQITPRKVAIAHTSIIQLSCTSYETAYLCENSSEVYILKSEVTIRVIFPFDRFPSEIQVSDLGCSIQHGDVYIIDLENPNPLENSINYTAMSSSPHRANASLIPSGPTFKPRRIWCSTKWATTAKHVAVGLDGDVIITTMSGHVYISYRRSGVNGAPKFLENRTMESTSGHTRKSYKFHRVQHLQRVSHVAANPTGSYAAIRTDVELRDIQPSVPDETMTLPSMLASMLPHLKKYAVSVPEVHTVPSAPLPSRTISDPYIRSGTASPNSDVHLGAEDDAVDDDDEQERQDLEWDCRVGSALFGLSQNWSDHQPHATLDSGDIFLVANSGEKILAHRFILCSRSPVLDQILNHLISVDGISYTPGEPEHESFPTLRFAHHGLLALLLGIHYIYTDTFPSIWDSRVWPHIENAHQEIPSTTRLCSSGKTQPGIIQLVQEAKESLKHLAKSLKLSSLEHSLARLGKATPEPLLSHHFRAILPSLGLATSRSPVTTNDAVAQEHHLVPKSLSPDLSPDMELELHDGEIMTCHSILMRAQCPFFRLMYDQEVWVTGRRQAKAAGSTNLIRIDMRHLRKKVLQVVLQHIYTDDAEDLFLAKDFLSLNDYIDFIFDVMSVANELMMDKLKYICSVVLRRCVNLSNVTAIAAEADFYRADSLKETCMNYMMYNLDALFEDKALIKIPDDLLMAIATYLKRVQMDKFPRSRSTTAMQELMDGHARFLRDLDLPKSKLTLTTRHWKSLQKLFSHQSNQAPPDIDTSFDKKMLRGSVEPSLRQLNSSSPTALNCRPIASGSSPKPHDSVNETIDDDAPFVMDDFDGAVSSTGKGLSKMRLNPSFASTDGSAWTTPIKKVTPIDLRTVMPLGKPRGLSQPHGGDPSSLATLSPRLPADMTPNQKLSQREKRRQSAEASKLRPDLTAASAIHNVQSKAPAWRSISGGSDRKIAGPAGQPLSALMSSASLSCSPGSSSMTTGAPKNVPATVALPGRAQGAAAKNPEPNDPASAVGASVITPIRAVNGIATSNSSRRTLAGQDTPWTNYVSTSTQFHLPGLNPSPFDLSSNLQIPGSHDGSKFESNNTHNMVLGSSSAIDTRSGSNPGSTSAYNTGHGKPSTFSIIQELQAKESWALYGAGKQKPKLAEIQEEENRLVAEKRQEEQFLKWFEEESLRLQQQQSTPPPPPPHRTKKSPHAARSKPGLASQVSSNVGGTGVTRTYKDKKSPHHQSHPSNHDPAMDSQASKTANPAGPAHDHANTMPRGKRKSKSAKAVVISDTQPTSGPAVRSTSASAATNSPFAGRKDPGSVPPSNHPKFSTQHQDHRPPALHHQNSSRVKAN